MLFPCMAIGAKGVHCRAQFTNLFSAGTMTRFSPPPYTARPVIAAVACQEASMSHTPIAAALDQLFNDARTYRGSDRAWLDRQVTDEQRPSDLRGWLTSANCRLARIVFVRPKPRRCCAVRSTTATRRADHGRTGHRALIGSDHAFYEHMDLLFPNTGTFVVRRQTRRHLQHRIPQRISVSDPRGSGRSGLDCGLMSGFNNALADGCSSRARRSSRTFRQHRLRQSAVLKPRNPPLHLRPGLSYRPTLQSLPTRGVPIFRKLTLAVALSPPLRSAPSPRQIRIRWQPHQRRRLSWTHFFGLSNPSARFSKVEGEVLLDTADLTKSSVSSRDSRRAACVPTCRSSTSTCARRPSISRSSRPQRSRARRSRRPVTTSSRSPAT